MTEAQIEDRICVWMRCVQRGKPTNLKRCPECGIPTESAKGYRGVASQAADHAASNLVTVERACGNGACLRNGAVVNDPYCGLCGNPTAPVLATPAGTATAARRGQAGNLPLGRAPQPTLPGTGTTIAITLLFGLFGLIPAYMNTDRARQAGTRTDQYWTAFWLSFVGSVVIWILFWVIILAAANSTAHG
jgi:hypothetical protein